MPVIGENSQPSSSSSPSSSTSHANGDEPTATIIGTPRRWALNVRGGFLLAFTLNDDQGDELLKLLPLHQKQVEIRVYPVRKTRARRVKRESFDGDE